MTPFSPAAAAETQSTWANGIRITEIPASAPDLFKRANADRTVDTLRTVCGHLRTAWMWLERKRSLQLSSRRLRVAETISLGEKRTISIITVDGAQYLIGSSSGGVQLLTRLDQPVENTGTGLTSEKEMSS